MLSVMSGITLAADTEKTDIAFLLRGYNDTTLYPTLESFRPEAALALAGLSELSFGKASTFEIFDGGVDVNGADYYSSETDIEAIDAALSGWVGEPWSYYLERDKDTGLILVDPADEEVAVLQSLRAWLLENRIGAISGWQESALGSENFEWVSDKVLRYGETAAEKFLKNVRLPASLDPKDYKMIGIIFSSRDEYNTSAAMHSCYYFGVKDANGEPIDELTSSEEQISCFYSDYSPIFEHSAAFWEASNRYVTIHEAIHAYGQYGHDRDSQLSDFPYSVMNQGPSYDQYPIWNRIYIQQWVSDNLITDDRDQLSDYKGASDLAGKYILRLSYENNYDCTDEFGEPQRCKRYQENYDGTLVQYRTPFVRDGVSTNPAGVIFEPINDISDTTIPVVESGHVDNYVVDPETNSVSDEIVISFSENIALGEGQIILLKDALPVATIETQRLPVLPSMSPSSGYLTIDGKTLTIKFSTADSNPQYSVRFGPEAIIDWGGNGVIGQHCAQVNDATPAIADTDEDGIIDCTDAFPLDPLETIDTDLDGTGDNADAFPNDSSETVDTDLDGVGDNTDVYPNDATASIYDVCRDVSVSAKLASASALPIEKRLVVANPASNKNQQTFVRFVNPSAESVDVELYGIDDSGIASKSPPVSFTLAAGESKQMTAQDLENGNTNKGLASSMCNGAGKWQITARSSKAIQIMGLIRTPDGFLTGLTDVVPVESGSNIVYFANAASNSQQQTFLRIVNNSASAGTVTITAIDNLGVAASQSVSFELAANGSKQMTAQDLENGNTAKGLTGKLGDGTGKWRLTIASSLDLSAQSLIRTPDGFLTNLSALVTPNASGTSTLNFFNPASNTAQQSFMRLVNSGTESSAITISGVDDAGQIAPNGDVSLTLAAGQSTELSAADLEQGNTDLQLNGSLGVGSGRWRLDVSSDPQISVMSYVLTSTGFLTNMSEVVGAASTTNTVWIFNPGSNSNQASKLRVINSGSSAASISISGIDDAGEASPGTNLTFNLSGGSVKEITAAELENGSSEKGLAGGIGDGKGKWRLTVTSDEPVTVQSLLETPAGFITNLSTSAQ
jgi:hypothetical protein